MVFNRGIFKNELLQSLCLALFFLGLSFYKAGYNFGRYFDIAYVKYFLSPELFTKDTLFFQHLESPYYYYHRIVAFLTKLTGLENNLPLLFAILYAIATFLTILALIKITDYLFQNKKTTVILLFLFVLNARLISLGEPSLHLTELSPQVMARPFLLFSLYFFLRKRYFISLAIAGIAFNIHLVTTAYLLGIYAIYFIYDFFSNRKFDIISLLKCWGICLVLALPTVVPIIGMLKPPEGTESWMAELDRYIYFGHLSPKLLFTLTPNHVVFSAFGALLLAITVVKSPLESAKNRMIITFFVAVGIMYLIGYLFVDVFLTRLFLEIQILRATWFIMLFGLIYVANFIGDSIENKYIHISIVLLIFLSLIFDQDLLWYSSILLIAISIGAGYIGNEKCKGLLRYWFPLLCLAGLILLNVGLKFMPSYHGIIYRVFNSLQIPSLMLVILAIGVISIMLIDLVKKARTLLITQLALTSLLLISVILPLRSINIQSSADPDWKDVQIWSNTTPKGSIFIIPLKYVGFYDYSNRPVFFNRACLGSVLMYPEKANEAFQRLADIGINLKDVARNHNWGVVSQEAWSQLGDLQLETLSRKYNVQYVVRERELPLHLEIAYENNTFLVYKID